MCGSNGRSDKKKKVEEPDRWTWTRCRMIYFSNRRHFYGGSWDSTD